MLKVIEHETLLSSGQIASESSYNTFKFLCNSVQPDFHPLTTSHQGFLTQTALKNISETTMYNLDCFEK
ncbi:MAG TPA: hypothetical protein PLT16_12415, partial [Daejeonella sp.]|nr:hypothetical protein [Daejeonella sp.]